MSKRIRTFGFLSAFLLALAIVLVPVPAAAQGAGSRLAVTAPAGWSPHPSNASMMMKGTGNYTLKPENLPAEAKTPDSFTAFAQKKFGASFANCKFGPVTSLKVGGNEARRFEFSGEVSGMKMNYIILYVFQGGKAHSLVCGAMADGFAALKPDFEKVVASARME